MAMADGHCGVAYLASRAIGQESRPSAASYHAHLKWELIALRFTPSRLTIGGALPMFRAFSGFCAHSYGSKQIAFERKE